MSLPQGLLDRLKKRGLISQREQHVEVFVEDKTTDDANDDEHKTRGGAPGCPNKWNEYHQCVDFCYDHWREGTGEDQLPHGYLTRRREFLRKYPLAEHWKEVYDAGVRRYYYWNCFTDEVCWFPPKHPRAVISISGPQAAAIFYEDLQKEHAAKASTAQSSSKNKRRRKDDDREVVRNDAESDEEVELNDVDKLKRARRRGIDPMDPAAYGDNVPVGGWGAGMNPELNEAADSSATGALFEKRPYPAPGAVLAKNRKADK